MIKRVVGLALEAASGVKQGLTVNYNNQLRYVKPVGSTPLPGVFKCFNTPRYLTYQTSGIKPLKRKYVV